MDYVTLFYVYKYKKNLICLSALLVMYIDKGEILDYIISQYRLLTLCKKQLNLLF
jgi:hypothetical protein